MENFREVIQLIQEILDTIDSKIIITLNNFQSIKDDLINNKLENHEYLNSIKMNMEHFKLEIATLRNEFGNLKIINTKENTDLRNLLEEMAKLRGPTDHERYTLQNLEDKIKSLEVESERLIKLEVKMDTLTQEKEKKLASKDSLRNWILGISSSVILLLATAIVGQCTQCITFNFDGKATTQE